MKKIAKKSKNLGGRPRLPDNERLGPHLGGVRLTRPEYDALERAAKSAGQSFAAYIRGRLYQ